MWSYATLALAALFLPLFPLSMVFNLLLGRVQGGLLRSLVIMLWPQIGIGILHLADTPVPAWMATWGALTALLYAVRALGLRDMGSWIGFMVTSSWALLWVAETFGSGGRLTHLHAVFFSVPPVLFVLLGEGLTQRYGAAYTGLYAGLATTLPRLSFVLVLVILATAATPLFPGGAVATLEPPLHGTRRASKSRSASNALKLLTTFHRKTKAAAAPACGINAWLKSGPYENEMSNFTR